MEYSLGEWFPASGVPAGTNLLVTGPPMTGKYELLLEVLAATVEGTIVVTAEHSATRVRDDYGQVPGSVPGDALGIVDCVSAQRGVEDVTDDAHTRYVPTPENLTRIGVKFTQFFDDYRSRYDRISVGLYSVSQLLMYSDVREVYQFLQVLTGKIQSADWLGAAVLDPTMHDAQTYNTLQNSFDAVLETRESEGRREFRVRGLEPEASDWAPF